MEEPKITQQEFAQLEPAQREAALESLDVALRLTPEEQSRRAIARTFAPAEVWGSTAASCLVHIVESYRRGHVDMHGAISDMQRICVGANSQFRILMLGLTAARLLQEQQDERKHGQRPPTWPLWLKTATADLIIVKQRYSPDERLSPSPHYAEQSSPLIEDALDILTRIGWYHPDNVPTQRTVYEWVRARLKEKPADQ
jgi:hypothetical protein